MATEGDWARQLSEDAANRPRNIFPTNDRTDPTHHGHEGPSPLGAVCDVLRSDYAKPTILAALAAIIGIGLGFWLGGKREAKRHESVVARVDIPDVMKLAPVLMELAANPLVRLYAARIVVRQVRKYLDNKLNL